MRDQVALNVWGKVLTGWTSVEITDSLESLSPTFSLSYSDRCLESDGTLRVSPGDECTVRIGGQTVITGYVDDSELEESATSRSLSVSGRSRTADLVDCTAERKPVTWREATVATIAADLCGPFKIKVSANLNVGAPFKQFVIEPGETVFDCISRAARQRGLMLQSTPAGELEIVSVGSRRAPAVLRRGENILSARLSLSLAERHSKIRVVSQAGGDSSDTGLFDRKASQASAVATDPNVPRYRPLVVVADCGESTAKLKERAAWEVTTRAGKGSRLSVTVPGWGRDGELWRPNAMARVVHDWLGLDTSMLISSVRLSLNDSGTKAALELAPIGAFTPEPLPPKNRKATWP